MKKSFRVLLVLVVGVIITACSNETLKSENNSNSKITTEKKISYNEEPNTSVSLNVSNSPNGTDMNINYEDIQIISESVENGMKTIKVFYPKDTLYIPTRYNGDLKLEDIIIATNGWIAAFSARLD
ncbi:hypothetical protein [Peribacillus sp. NPDC097295]|uniref:hypothetical protein n=1 Tax=Peribacillus sp. NPDC097295 TaxID=3364402 RepID=UPI0037F21333